MSDTTERPSASITGSGLTSDLGTSRVATIIHGGRTGFRCLDAWEIRERDFNVVTRGGQSTNSQRWVLTDTGGGLYTIMQVSSDRYLDAHEIESLDFRVVTRPRQDNDTQLWRILSDGGRAAIHQVSSGRALQPYLTEDMDFQVVTRPPSDDDIQWLWGPFLDGVFPVDRSAEFERPAAAGAPTACVIPGLGVQNIVYRDTTLQLQLLTRDSQGVTGWDPLTAAARITDPNTPLATGDPFGYVDTTRNTEILLYRSRDDDSVHSLSWSTSRPSHNNLSGDAGTPPAEGNPVGYYMPITGDHRVIYRESHGHLYYLSWDGGINVGGYDRTATFHAPAAAGDPTAFVTATGVELAVYRSESDGHIRSLWAEEATGFGVDDLSGVAGTPPAVADPVGYYTAHDDTVQVVYRAGHGRLHELYAAGNATISGWNIMPDDAPPAIGTPAAYYSPGTNTKHVAYRSADDRLHEIWWVPGESTTNYIEPSMLAGEDSHAKARPAAFAVPGANSLHLAYRGNDRDIHELRRWW